MKIEITNLVKTFNNEVAVHIDNITFSTEITGIIGNNGAGKTTLFRLLMGILKMDNGKILINNKDIRKTDDWKMFTSSFIDEGFLIEYLTPMEYFEFIASINNIPIKTLNERLSLFKGLLSKKITKENKLIRSYSMGNKYKIGIIGALISYPQILILDEPFNYLDPTSQLIMTDIIINFQKTNNSIILISSHNLEYVSKICRRIILLEKGKVLYDFENINDSINIITKYFKQQR